MHREEIIKYRYKYKFNIIQQTSLIKFKIHKNFIKKQAKNVMKSLHPFYAWIVKNSEENMTFSLVI